MKRFALIAAAVIVALAIAGQLALPRLAEDEVESRLTEGGGEAEVSVEAVPAARLLWGDGDRFSVRGTDLGLDLSEDPEVFSRLDGFAEVDVALDDFRAGPFEVESFALRRDGDGPYALRSSSTTSGAELLEYGAERLGFAGAPLVRFLAERSREATRRYPVELDMELESEDGRIRVVSGGGTVAGYPTGPLAEILTAAIVVRL